MEDIKLRPCPFCACEYSKDEYDFVYAGQHEEWCPLNVRNNGLENLVVNDDPESIERWNRRNPDGEKILEVLHKCRNYMEQHGGRAALGLAGLNYMLEKFEEYHATLSTKCSE